MGGSAPQQSRPRVSVVIPSHSRPALLARAVSTALAQRDVEVEVVVVDDGSPDPEAVARVCARPGVVLHRHESCRGVAHARNTGLAVASAPHVAFLDDDDVWHPGKLVGQVAALSAAPGARWSLSGAVTVDEQLEPLWLQSVPAPGEQWAAMLRRNLVPGGASNVLVERALVLELGGFDPALSTAADWDLWIRLASRAPLAVDESVHVGYVKHPHNMTLDVDLSLRERQVVLDKHEASRRDLGVVLDQVSWTRWVAREAGRGRGRRDVARLHLRLAGIHQVPPRERAASLARAARALLAVHPSRRAAGPTVGISARWAVDARAWLAPQRAGGHLTGRASA